MQATLRHWAELASLVADFKFSFYCVSFDCQCLVWLSGFHLFLQAFLGLHLNLKAFAPAVCSAWNCLSPAGFVPGSAVSLEFSQLLLMWGARPPPPDPAWCPEASVTALAALEILLLGY